MYDDVDMEGDLPAPSRLKSDIQSYLSTALEKSELSAHYSRDANQDSLTEYERKQYLEFANQLALEANEALIKSEKMAAEIQKMMEEWAKEKKQMKRNNSEFAQFTTKHRANMKWFKSHEEEPETYNLELLFGEEEQDAIEQIQQNYAEAEINAKKAQEKSGDPETILAAQNLESTVFAGGHSSIDFLEALKKSFRILRAVTKGAIKVGKAALNIGKAAVHVGKTLYNAATSPFGRKVAGFAGNAAKQIAHDAMYDKGIRGQVARAGLETAGKHAGKKVISGVVKHGLSQAIQAALPGPLGTLAGLIAGEVAGTAVNYKDFIKKVEKRGLPTQIAIEVAKTAVPFLWPGAGSVAVALANWAGLGKIKKNTKKKSSAAMKAKMAYVRSFRKTKMSD